jgi:hypothetical protein
MRILRQIVAVLVLTTTLAISAEADVQVPSLICDIGPVHKTYAKSSWLVYACNVPNNVQIVTDSGNWAGPFYFSISIQYNGDVTIFSKSTGGKPELVAALNEMHMLTKADVMELLEQAKAAKPRASAK